MKNLKTLVVSLIAIAGIAGCTSKKTSHSSQPSSVISSSESGSSSSSAASSASAPTSATAPSSASSSSSRTSTPSSNSSVPSSSSSSSVSSSSSSVPVVPQGVTISFADRVAEYVAKGYSGVVIPDYECADSSATISAISGYDGYYLIKPSSSAEMEAFVAKFSSDWEDEVDSYGDHHLYLGETLPGESCPYIYVGDYTAESLAGIVISFDEYTEPVPAAGFPLEEVNAYLTENSSDYGFMISQAEADAISALSTSFVFYSGTYNGYPICQVTIGGEVAAEVEAVLVDTITGAGFEYDSEYGAYYNSIYCMISFAAEDGSTYFTLY